MYFLNFLSITILFGGRSSHPFVCVFSDDTSARSKVVNYLNSGHIIREESLQQASVPCERLKSEMYDEEFYCVETTGAKVTLSSSVSLIYFYCSRLPSDRYMFAILFIRLSFWLKRLTNAYYCFFFL